VNEAPQLAIESSIRHQPCYYVVSPTHTQQSFYLLDL